MYLLSCLGSGGPSLASRTMNNTTAFPDAMFSEQYYAKYFCFVEGFAFFFPYIRILLMRQTQQKYVFCCFLFF